MTEGPVLHEMDPKNIVPRGKEWKFDNLMTVPRKDNLQRKEKKYPFNYGNLAVKYHAVETLLPDYLPRNKTGG